MHKYILTYMHTYKRTHINTYIHTYKGQYLFDRIPYGIVTKTAWSEYSSDWSHGTRHELSNTALTVGGRRRGCVCICLLCLCVILWVGRCLAADWFLVEGLLQTVYRIKKLKRWPRSNKRLQSHNNNNNNNNNNNSNNNIWNEEGWGDGRMEKIA
jgi:hypothetical protein